MNKNKFERITRGRDWGRMNEAYAENLIMRKPPIPEMKKERIEKTWNIYYFGWLAF